MLRVVFMGTPDFAVPVLTEIVGQGHDVAAVYSQPPRRAGRGHAERPSPVHAQAETFGLSVETPQTLRDQDAEAMFAGYGADVCVVVAYGQILPQTILNHPKHGCLNLHASLLPRWRGAAPIHRAIMAGDNETGVAVMKMEAGLDTGPVGMEERVAIGPNETTGALHDRLARLGADLMVRALGALERGQLDFRDQSQEGVTYANKIDKAEARVDWSWDVAKIHNHARGLSPFPGAWTNFGNGERLKLLGTQIESAMPHATPGTILDEDLTVACTSGAVRLVTVQRAGKQPMTGSEFLRGSGLSVGDRMV